MNNGRYSIKFKDSSEEVKARFSGEERGFLTFRQAGGKRLICRKSDVDINELPAVPQYLYLAWPSAQVLAEGDSRDELQENIELELGPNHFQDAVFNGLVLSSDELVKLFKAWCKDINLEKPFKFAYVIVEKANLTMALDLVELYQNNLEREETSEELC
tara:strand:+ start:1455 stop:1931 length:477 start_codon:yes stop_codon:yes gene_type:complete